ncbi:precorrin-6A synthase (deacetylating) [Devosia sp. 1566]|uniref:precorrin-6A synthase (deacetylating) n=1 Tax=Devosia sp. 1566 TaxID=2499144 RepID=UPI000FDB0E46|nr:precorrin-6A synthase (deacetylating) [Devosia sp. 1566]
MKTIILVGIGTGNPEHLTVQAINALQRAGTLFIPDKGQDKAELAQVRRDICERYLDAPNLVPYRVPTRRSGADYNQTVSEWHATLAGIFAELIATHVPDGGSCAFLVWGDPGLYDSTLRIIAQLPQPQSFKVEVIPGITSIQALTSAHAIALNRIGEPVQITTGRRLVESGLGGDSVVMLDGQTAFIHADPELEIFWGAYLGTPDQLTIAGRLGDVRDTILETRRAARARHGWIMDIYLLRQREP